MPQGQRYKLVLEYLGSGFSGWQEQSNSLLTAQGALRYACKSFLGRDVQVFGSSRTDAGVHALGQVAHVDLLRVSKSGEEMPPDEPRVVLKGLNSILNQKGWPIIIRSVEMVGPEFHARFSSNAKIYHYHILANCRAHDGPLFERDRAWILKERLDVPAMQAAARVLIGEHDFSSFRAAGCTSASPVKLLSQLDVESVDASTSLQQTTEQQQFLRIVASSKSFMYHQVRNLSSALVEAGKGKLSPSDVQRILRAKDRALAPATAPAHGLFLCKVIY